MMGISKEKSIRTHHQWDHQYIHASGATLDNEWTYDPSIFGHGFPKTKARILGFGDVRVWNMELVMELVTEFTGDQMEMINETIVEAIMGAITVMITELTGDWIRDWIRNQPEMINEMTMEMTAEMILELIPEMILELTSDQAETSDPDGCPLTVSRYSVWLPVCLWNGY